MTTYGTRDPLGAGSGSLHGASGILMAAACGAFLPLKAAGTGLPALAVAATLAPGVGALSGALLHEGVQRAAGRALVLAGAAAAILWASEFAFGLQHAAQGAGLAALWLIGVALVPAQPGALATGLARAGALVLLGLILDGAPAAWGLFQETPPWSPEVAARLLDASPRAFTMEIAGFDWMRHPTVYESVGTDRISPSLRQSYGHGGLGMAPWRQAVAVLPLLVVGSTATALRLLTCRSKLSASSR